MLDTKTLSKGTKISTADKCKGKTDWIVCGVNDTHYTFERKTGYSKKDIMSEFRLISVSFNYDEIVAKLRAIL